MKKFYSLLMAVVLMAIGSLSINAATQEVATKMTYVNGGATTESYGVVTSAQTGFNKISGGAVALGNSAWGANNVIFIQVDASAVTSDITKVTLSMESSGSTDSKRTAGIGVGYNSSAWSETLTWDTADRSITTLGAQQWTATKSAAVFEAMNFDITEAFKDDADKVVTILVYNTQAAGNNIQNVKAVAEYAKADEVLVNYSFNDAENPVMTPDGSNSNRGTCNYDYDSPIDGAKFLNVWGENNSNGFKVASITAKDVTTYGQWTLEFDWAGYSGCNGKAGQTKLVDLEGKTFFSIDDAAGWGATFSLSTGQTVECYPCNKATRISANTGSVLELKYWHHFTVIGTANGVSVTIEQYGKDEGGNITKTVVVKNAKASATNVTPASIGLRPGSCGSVAIDNLKLTVGDLKIVSHNYTVKFVDQNGLEFKDAETRNAVDGEALAVTDADKETIINGNTQYTYVSDDAAERVVDADDMVLTIVYNKTTVSNYVVNFINSEGSPLKDPVTHKNINVGTEVVATAGEMAQLLVNGVFYNYSSGNDQITVSEDETTNVINLVFAPVEGVTGYFLQNYETGTVDWTTSTGGRFTPIIVDGSTIADRATTVRVEKVDPLTGEIITDGEGNPVYEDVPGESIPFANKTNFLAADQNTRNQNGAQMNSNALNIEQDDFTFEAKVILGTPERDKCSFNIRNKANDANIFTITPATANATNTDWVINDDAENFKVNLPNTGNISAQNGNNTLTNYSWYNLKVTVYNGLTFVTITDEGGNKILDKAQVPTSATSYGISNMTFPTGRYHGNFAIDDVLVRSVVVAEDIPAGMEFYAVKINYVDETGKILKPAEEQKFNAGATIELNSAFKADFKVTEAGEVWTAESEAAPATKYIYVSDNSADVTVAEGAEVNIVYRGVAPRRVILRAQIQLADGTMATKDASGANLPTFYDSRETGENLFEGDVLEFFYPYYMLVDGLLYKTAANGGGTDKGSLTIEAGTTAQLKSPITWTPATEAVPVLDEDGNQVVDPETEQPVTRDEQISNAVFAQETENIEGITVVKDQFTKIRMANGAAGSAIGGDVVVATLEPGKYTLTTATRSGTTNFAVNGVVVHTIASSGTITTTTSPEFTVDQTADLVIQQQTSITNYSDYILVRKTGDVETNEITLVAEMENGAVVVPEVAAAGAVIKPVITPAKGYELESSEITVKDADGADVAVSDGAFTMPASAVTVTVNATFVPKKVYIETDLTADFAALTINTNWKNINGGTAGYTATSFCPAVTTNAGQTVQVCEFYAENCEYTGDVLTQTVTGLTPGTYKIELYGGAAYTFGRGFSSEAFSQGTWNAGDKIEPSAEVSTGVTLYAKTADKTYGGEIPLYYATNFPEGAAVVAIEGVEIGEDGSVTIGINKTSKSTNWHIVQLKGVTAQVLASDVLNKSLAKIVGYTEDDLSAEMYSEVQETIATYNQLYDTADEYKAAIAAVDAVAEKAIPDAKLIANTKAVEGATYGNPVETAFVVNGTFDNGTSPWITTTGAQNKGTANNQQGAFTVPFWENWNPDPFTGKLYQTVENIPNGVYSLKIAAFVNNFAGEGQQSQYVYGNENKTYLTTGTPTAYEVRDIVVTDNKIEVGFEQTEAVANWCGIDNAVLYYHGAGLPYEIEVAQTEHGTLNLPAKAGAGEEVVINATADEGYELASVIVTGSVSNSVIEVTTDEWTGVQSFVMPAEAVTVSAKFQQAYVKLSNYALEVSGEFVNDPEFGDEIVAKVAYDSEIVGSYAESFALNADFAYEVTDAAGEVVASGSKNPLNVSDGLVTIYIDNLAPNSTYTIKITGVEVTDFDMSTFESVVVFKQVVGLDGAPLASATFTTGLPTGIAGVEAAEDAVKADGKYLENGKIVIYKNGNKYDANGAIINK